MFTSSLFLLFAFGLLGAITLPKKAAPPKEDNPSDGNGKPPSEIAAIFTAVGLSIPKIPASWDLVQRVNTWVSEAFGTGGGLPKGINDGDTFTAKLKNAPYYTKASAQSKTGKKLVVDFRSVTPNPETGKSFDGQLTLDYAITQGEIEQEVFEALEKDTVIECRAEAFGTADKDGNFRCSAKLVGFAS